MAERRIVVIGAGVMGLACAWRLARGGAREGARVEVVEARGAGEGATLAALGALWPASPLTRGPLQVLHRASLWEFEAFARELAEAAGMPVRVRRLGRLELLNSEKAVVRAAEEAVAACAEWPRFGGELPVMEVLAPERIAAEYPGLARVVFPGVLCRATAQVCVGELVAALVGACTRAGVKLRTQMAVTGLAVAGDRVTGVVTGAGVVEAEVVVVTAGAWTGLLGDAVAVVAPVRPAKGQGLALRMPAGVAGGGGRGGGLERIVKADKIYLIPWRVEDGGGGGGEILVGSTTEPEAGFDEMPTAAAREKLCAGAAAIMPGLRGAEVLRHWAGLRPQNPAKRHPPIMGPHPRWDNVFICTGHFKTGVGLAPRVSRLVRESIFDGVLAGELEAFRPKGA